MHPEDMEREMIGGWKTGKEHGNLCYLIRASSIMSRKNSSKFLALSYRVISASSASNHCWFAITNIVFWFIKVRGLSH